MEDLEMSSKLITPESPLLVPPLLAAEIGLNEALILQQIHYYCLVSKHVKQDGRTWFWKTLNDWGQTLPFLSISTIRRAIGNLKDKFKLIDVCRHSQKTWYQANWFTINVENLEALWNSICPPQQMDVTILDKSICSDSDYDIKDFLSEDFPSQKKAAGEKSFSADPDLVEQQVMVEEAPELNEPTSFEQPTVTHFVDEPTLVPSTNDLKPREDASPVPADEREEENMKLCEVRDAIGSLTPKLKKLVVDFTLGDLKKALALYRDRHQKQPIHNAYSWLKKCLEQKWWQDKPANTNQPTDARKNIPETVAAKEKLTDEQKAWYERAVTSGICLPAAIEELPVKMGLVCAKIAIPYQPLFDIFPIEELIVQYPL
jgi:hypothetical protein